MHILRALTTESPYGGMHTSIISNINGVLVDQHKNGSYHSLLSKHLGGTWNQPHSCYALYNDNYIVTNYPTGSSLKRKYFTQQTVKVNAAFIKKLKAYFINNNSGHLYWKAKNNQKKWDSPVVLDTK